MASIYLAGAENPAHQQIMASCAALKVAVNVTSLRRRKTFSWSLDLPYPEWEWVAYCDGPATAEDLQLVLDAAAKPPTHVIGPPSWEDHPGYIPLWNGEGDMPRHSGLVVTDRVFRDKAMRRKTLSSRTLGTVLGAITGTTDTDIGRLDIVVSGAWWSSMKYGETQVWDGRAMHRYNADRKSEVRARHRDDILALGIDFDAVMLEDPDETARLAVASWRAYEESLSRANVVKLVPRSEVSINEDDESMSDVSSGSAIDMPVVQDRHRALLPVIGLSSITTTERQGDGSTILEEQPVVRSVHSSIRACDNCYLAQAGCPGFQPGHRCAYAIPVEIRSKDQLQAVMQALIEMQTQRVLMARFAEELSGQELTPEVGRELDRLFSSVEKMRDIMDNRDTLKMTVEARGKAGVLSRLFGDRVGANARVLGTPIDPDNVIDTVFDDR